MTFSALHAGASQEAASCFEGQCAAETVPGGATPQRERWDYSGVLSATRTAGVAFSGETPADLLA